MFPLIEHFAAIWIETERLNSQHTVQAKSVGGAEMTAFIKAFVVGDKTSMGKKPLHNPFYGPVNNM